MINGATGLRNQLKNLGLEVVFANKSNTGSTGESFPDKGVWRVNIDANKMAGSLAALRMTVVHELAHGVTFATTYGKNVSRYNDGVDQASVAYGKMIRAEGNYSLAGSADNRAAMMQARNNYYFGTANEGPSYRAEQAAWLSIFGR